MRKKNLQKLFAAFLLIFLPTLAFAIPVVDPRETVPVPYEPTFGCGIIRILFNACGPAGQVTASGLILSFIQIALAIVGILAVLFVMIGGFRYVTAHGNEEQAEAAKKTLTHAIVGVVLVVLAFVIVRLITNALIFGPLGT